MHRVDNGGGGGPNSSSSSSHMYVPTQEPAMNVVSAYGMCVHPPNAESDGAAAAMPGILETMMIEVEPQHRVSDTVETEGEDGDGRFAQQKEAGISG